jgi:hypothetical protein
MGGERVPIVGGVLPLGQKHTYIPFHFIPRSKKGEPNFDWRTAPDCRIARELVEIAVKELKDARSEMRVRKLIKLGIALHSYADTWAHKDFSGRFSAEQNAVADASYMDGNTWKRLEIDFGPSIVPEIGHAKAYVFPDASHLRWKYKNGQTREDFERDNPVIFREAAKSIYMHLCQAAGTQPNWNAVQADVEACLRFGDGINMEKDAVKRKNHNICSVFNDINFTYDEYEWKEAALIPLKRAGDSMTPVSFRSDKMNMRNLGANMKAYIDEISYKFREGTKNNLKWFYFHIEAAKQRRYVLDNVNDINEVFDTRQVSSFLHNVIEGVLNISPFHAATELRKKDHWMTVTVKNVTQYPIVWKGRYDSDFVHPFCRYWDLPLSTMAPRIGSWVMGTRVG